MDRSQSFNVSPFFSDDSNYAYWKVKMRAFLKSIDEMIWTTVDLGLSRPEGLSKSKNLPNGLLTKGNWPTGIAKVLTSFSYGFHIKL